jgi:hypothetical protein
MTCTAEPFTAARRHPELVELAGLEARIAEGAGHLAAATGAWLALVEEFDRRQGWAVHGLKSCAHWLSWRCGIGLVAGREHVRVARALADLPVTRAALAAGRLSYSKARALTRVATAQTEASLVDVALHATGAQLEQLTAGLRKAGSLGKVNARHAARSLSWSWAEDGSLELRGRFSPEDGAVILAALAAARDALAPDPGASAEASPGPCARDRSVQRGAGQVNADAMVVLAETMLATGPAAAPGGQRYQVHLHTDLDALTDALTGALTGALTEDAAGDAAGDAGASNLARIEDGPQLHPETLRRLCCDSGAVIVAHHQKAVRTGGRRGTWMDVGRRTRVVPAALRRALTLRDGGCRFPGCTETRFVDAHHVIFWSRRGPTALWNLILLCRRHHRYVHEGGYQVQADQLGGFSFQNPHGQVIPDVPSPTGGTAQALPGLHDALITAQTAVPDWNGDRLDLHYAVSVHTQQPRHASAEAWIPTPPTDPQLN